MPFVRGVECDACGARVLYREKETNLPQRFIKDELRKEGWTFGKNIKCPLCRKHKSKGK